MSTPVREEGQRSPAKALLSLLKDYGVPAISILGVVLYGMLRLAYLFFYLRLRTTPEEVGYGYSRVLSESVVGAIELIVLVFVPLLLIGLGLDWGVTIWRRRRPSRVPGAARNAPRSHPLRRVAIRGFIASVVIVVVSLPVLASWQGRLAQRGQTVRNVYFIGIPYLPVLAVQAVPVRVSWVNPDSESEIPLAGRRCLLYLGASNGTAVFYDVRSRESLRLPQSEIAVTFLFAFFVDPQCRIAFSG